MKTSSAFKAALAALAAFASVLAAQAGNSWLYDSVAKTLTEQVTDASAPWVIGGITVSSGKLTATATSSNYSTLTTTGDSTELDFTTVTNSAGTAYPLVKFSDYILQYRTTITKIIAPELTAVGQYAFRGSTALVDIVAPKLAWATTRSFNNCSSLSFPSRWDEERKCTDLDNITFVSTATFYDSGLSGKVSFKGYTMSTTAQNLFMNCNKMTEIVLKPNVAHDFPSACFSGCTSLTNVYPLTHVKIFYSTMFSGCTALEELELGRDGGTGVILSGASNAGVCYNLTGLKELTLGGNVTNIGTYAIYGCNNLNFLKWGGTKPKSFGSHCFSDLGKDTTLRQYFPATNTAWVAEIEANAYYTKWRNLDGTTKDIYTTAYPDGERPDGYCSGSAYTSSYLRKGFVFFYGKKGGLAILIH